MSTLSLVPLPGPLITPPSLNFGVFGLLCLALSNVLVAEVKAPATMATISAMNTGVVNGAAIPVCAAAVTAP